ncbi:class I SAM-dependent methyltransferase [Mycobacterium sp. ACS4331]|uniref:SAM-dependent methyltransferase n=1 Tax=Mycobacterium sp. ACS4331 TaxID=1834121 RepID=UPI0007FFD2B6|nr:class I SAM-dependent methyltransferase [Mycobacterium sp. ACS4331]OBF26126.1 SAM-dependent methyltransferase [Mycobacterium sp. ACS4331]
MSRSDADSWDLASSVGATATMVAAARALASADPDPLIDDPYAADLVRAVGIDFFTRLVDGTLDFGDERSAAAVRLMVDAMAVRTRFFDDFFLGAGWAGDGPQVRQAVILASGLDSRPYRLDWAPGTVVYEIDQPQVLAAKAAAMSELGATPAAAHRAVAVDLRDDWPAALCDSGFDASAAAAFSAEGLLMYLPPDAQDRLFDDITALSAAGSRIATEFHGGDFGASLAERTQGLTGAWQADGFDLDLGNLMYPGERSNVVDYLRERGWQVRTRDRADVYRDYGKQFSTDELMAPLRNSVAVTAIRDQER